MKTRILLADDQELFVEGLRSVFATRARDFEIVDIAHDGREAVVKAGRCHPDLILMDVRMPSMDGVEAARLIHEQFPDIMIVMLTTYDDDHYVRRAVRNGAIGYLLKDVPPEELFNAIRTIRNGSFIMPTPLASKLFETSIVDAYHGGASEGSVPEWYYELSRKERHILRLIVDGYDNHEIAAEVNLAPQTVKNYSSGIYGKMGVHARTDAIREAKSLIKYL